MEFLRQRVRLEGGKGDDETAIGFDAPTVDEMVGAGLDPQGSRQILDAPWWDEMVDDVVETPEMCDEEDTPDQVLEYAKDVVSEYIRKRAQL
jgi:hypothetical protein